MTLQRVPLYNYLLGPLAFVSWVSIVFHDPAMEYFSSVIDDELMITAPTQLQ